MSSLFKTLGEDPVKFDKMNPSGPKSKTTGLKVAIIISFILSLVALAGAGYLRNALEKERGRREELEAVQAQLRQKADAFEKSSAQYQKDFQQVQNQVNVYTAEKQKLQKELDESRAQVEELKKNIAVLQEEKAKAQEIAAPADTATAAEGEVAPAAEEQTAAPSAAMSAPAASKPPQVLSLNRKFNFAVVNIGLQQKLKIGDVLEVIRDGNAVAQLQVEKLYESFSAASITKEPKDAPIKEGDQIRQVP